MRGTVQRSGTTWLFLAVEEGANLFRDYVQHVLIVLLHFDASVIEVKDKLWNSSFNLTLPGSHWLIKLYFVLVEATELNKIKVLWQYPF